MKRSKEEIIGLILEICKEPSTKTRVVYQANLNFRIAAQYLDMLIDVGHLEASEPPIRYKTTQKGIELLERIKSIHALLKQIDKQS